MPERRRVTLHTHIGFLVIGSAFVGTLLAGTLWKLVALHLVASGSPTAHTFGKAMLVQYG